MIELVDLHRAWRATHIVLGFLGLFLFWIPVLATKGSRLHVVSGRLFAICAYVVAGTGLLSSVWGVVDPASFLERTRDASASTEPTRAQMEGVRFILSITGFLSLAVIAGVTLGRRVMNVGERHEALRSPWLVVLLVAVVVWSAGLALYGAASLIAGYAGWHVVAPTTANRYWINTALGVFGVWGTIADLKYVYGPTPTRVDRWTVHIQCMVGSGAGFYAAFFLFGANRVSPSVSMDWGHPGIWIGLRGELVIRGFCFLARFPGCGGHPRISSPPAARVDPMLRRRGGDGTRELKGRACVSIMQRASSAHWPAPQSPRLSRRALRRWATCPVAGSGARRSVSAPTRRPSSGTAPLPRLKPSAGRAAAAWSVSAICREAAP